VASGADYGRDDLPKLAEDMQLEIDDLFPLTDAAELLDMAEARSGDSSILPAGQAFAAGDIQRQKQVIAHQ
jgi:NitT/TauT family transport system ATP-binding protein